MPVQIIVRCAVHFVGPPLDYTVEYDNDVLTVLVGDCKDCEEYSYYEGKDDGVANTLHELGVTSDEHLKIVTSVDTYLRSEIVTLTADKPEDIDNWPSLNSLFKTLKTEGCTCGDDFVDDTYVTKGMCKCGIHNDHSHCNTCGGTVCFG